MLIVNTGLRVALGLLPVFSFLLALLLLDSFKLVRLRTVAYLIIAGGASYTLGVAFYLLRRLPYNHAVWHLFVLGGSAAHFIAVYVFVG